MSMADFEFDWFLKKNTANISVSCLEDEGFYYIGITFSDMEMNLIYMDQ